MAGENEHVAFDTELCAANPEAAADKIAELEEALAQALRHLKWQPIETCTEKNEPILAWCDHEADPYILDEAKGTLTLYAAHAEGMSHAPTGRHIVEWGGAFDDTSWEDFGQGAWLPDWWFVAGSEFEVAANPTHWMPLPAPPAVAKE